MGEETKFVTEIPSSLKALARLIARGFYSREDCLIVDMLVRNHCMKEDDICDLMKFEKKMLRARVSILKNDKFLQTKLKMETAPDGKSQRMNYYYINYKSFVNMVKYKLDHIRRKLETEERDATSRASFKCPGCLKKFTDLEADQLFDFNTQEFRCTYCNSIVEEDEDAMPKVDSRLLLSKFNDQMEPIYKLLRDVEGVRLAPELLEPEPFDMNSLKKNLMNRGSSAQPQKGEDGVWSGEATRNKGFSADTAVEVEFGAATSTTTVKEKPIWMVESTVSNNDTPEIKEETFDQAEVASMQPSNKGEDIMSVLLAVEQPGAGNAQKVVIPGQEEEGSDSEPEGVVNNDFSLIENDEDIMAIDSDDSDEEPIPFVTVNGTKVLITEVSSELLASMTPKEKDDYIQAYQEFYNDNDAD